MATLALYKRKKPIPREKVERVRQLAELLRKYDKVVIVDFHEVPANLLKKARMAVKKLGAYPIVVKNTLLEKAIEQVVPDKPYVQLLRKYLGGMRMLVFTNGDVFEVARVLDEHKEKVPPKPGKKCPEDIVIKKGGTGIKPGPAMTDLRVAGLPIRIIDGELFIMKDTVLVKKGQRLSPQTVKVLQILDISPFIVGPKVLGAIEAGIEISADVLLKPLEEYERMLQEAIAAARNVAVNAVIPVPDVVPDIISKAVIEAIAVASEAGIITSETAEIVLTKAFNLALCIAQEIAKISPDAIPEDLKSLIQSAAPAETKPAEEKKEEKVEEKKEEKKEEEESEFVGLAALF